MNVFIECLSANSNNYFLSHCCLRRSVFSLCEMNRTNYTLGNDNGDQFFCLNTSGLTLQGTKPKISISVFWYFWRSYALNDLHTKRKSNKPTISSKNDAEKCRLWLSKVKYDTYTAFLSLYAIDGVESTVVSTLQRFIVKNTAKICNLSVYPHWLMLALWRHNGTFHFPFLKRWMVRLFFF